MPYEMRFDGHYWCAYDYHTGKLIVYDVYHSDVIASAQRLGYKEEKLLDSPQKNME